MVHELIVKKAMLSAKKRWGGAWHVLAPEVREELIKAAALDIVAGQMDASQPMVQYAREVIQAIGRLGEVA